MKLLAHRKIIGGVLVAGALLLSACGTSGGSDAADSDASEETTTTEAATTTEDPAADAQARAETVTLTEADFPEGWSSAGQPPDDDDDANNPLTACSENFSDKSDNVATHATDDFQIGSIDDGDGSQFGAETIVFTDEEAATAAVEELSDPEVVTCIDGALKEVFGEGTPGITVTGEITADDITVDLGTDAIAGISGTFEISADDGSTATANIGILAMSTGDVGTMVTILSLGTSLDPTTLVEGPITTLAELQAEA